MLGPASRCAYGGPTVINQNQNQNPQENMKSVVAAIKELKEDTANFLQTRYQMLLAELKQKISAIKLALPLFAVAAVFGLGQVIGLTMAAEGVESPEQRDLLIAAGCSEMQGHLFSAAVPILNQMEAGIRSVAGEPSHPWRRHLCAEPALPQND